MTDDTKSIAIIGRNGQVSRSLYEVLTAAGYAVAQIGRPDADLCDPISLSNAICDARPSIVINAAAYTAVDRAEDEPDTAHAANAIGAQAASDAAAKAGAAIIHFSTDYVFDGTKRTPYVEADVVAPIGVYGQSKLAGERLVAAANPKHIILRTAWVFSPFGNNFAKTMLRLNQERPEINVVDDQYGTPTYAPDLAEAVHQIVHQLDGTSLGPEFFGTFHAANSGETSWYNFASAIIDGAAQRGAPHAAVHPIGTKDFPTKAQRPAYSVLSTDKLAHTYGIRLRAWQNALSDCLDRIIGPPHDAGSPHLQQGFGKSA